MKLNEKTITMVSGFCGGIFIAATLTASLIVFNLITFLYEWIRSVTHGYGVPPQPNYIYSVFVFVEAAIFFGMIGALMAFAGQIPENPEKTISLKILKISKGGLYEIAVLYASLILMIVAIILFLPLPLASFIVPFLTLFSPFIVVFVHDIWLFFSKKIYNRLMKLGSDD